MLCCDMLGCIMLFSGRSPLRSEASSVSSSSPATSACRIFEEDDLEALQ
jgi:hypothetical protein